jgi:broad specificity phosphatase PhoE
MTDQNLAFDGAIRRRIHLFRHGDVSYVDEAGNRVADPRLVPLTKWGHEQASHMGDFVKDTPFDRAICSGLRRTKETAAGVLRHSGHTLEEIPEFEEIRSSPEGYLTIKHLDQVAYAFHDAHTPEARFIGGESFAEFDVRVLSGLEKILAQPDWKNLALVAHGGTNRVILGWALGLGLKAFSTLEQNTCCMNIIDVDTDPESGHVVRTLVRGINVTTYDPVRQEDHLTTLETLAKRFQDFSLN